jgi:hypothetical protein
MKWVKGVLSFLLFVTLTMQTNLEKAAADYISIESGVSVTESNYSPDEEHIYSFTTDEDGEVRIELDNTSAGYSMYLYNEHNNNLGGDYYSSGGNKIVIYKNVQRGTYYVKVAPYNWSNVSYGTYRLKATYGSDVNRDSTTFEPNNTIGTSFSVSSGVLYKSTSDSSIDLDVYHFSTAKDGEVRVELENATAGYSMYLYDDNDNQIGGDYYSSSGNKIVINKKVQKGKYFIKISPYSWSGISSGSYTLKATYPGVIKRDSKTFEPNNTMETSYPITSGVAYSSKSDSSIDQDVYRFTTPKNGEVRIELDQTTAGYSMYLYDENGNQVSGDYYSSSGSKIVIYVKVDTGTYYIKVSPYSWSGTTYATYRIKATYAAAIKHDSKTFEPNNTVETSYPVASGMTYNSTSSSNIDLDVYKFTTSKDGEVLLTLNKTTAGYSMYLYDSNGNSISGDYYSSSGNTITLRKNLAKGTYYIKVSPYNWSGTSSASYRLFASYPVVRSVKINGQLQKYNHQFVNGTVLVPLKEVSAKLGAKVFVDIRKKSITVTRGKNKMVVTSGSKAVVVNGKKVNLSVTPVFKSDNFMIPSTLFKDAFGAKVTFEPGNHTVHIDLK